MDNIPTSLLLELQKVTVAVPGETLLNKVSLKVHAGEIVSLIGPNGAGKSTLVKTGLGLIKPTSGIVNRRTGLNVGYVPQKLSIDPNLPLKVENLMTLTQKRDQASLQSALKETGVENLTNRSVSTLSGGELQRVLMARALARKPDLLVLDEPTQGVDFAGEQELIALISAIRHRYQCGILLISHNLHMVMANTDQVVCLNRHICCHGQPNTVRNHPDYQAMLGTFQKDGLVRYHHQHPEEMT